MKQILFFFTIFFCISYFGCTQSRNVKYNDNIFLIIAQTPDEFSKKHKVQIQYYIPETDSRDKGEATQQVYIKTNEYRIFWKWQYDKYIPDLFEFSKNIVNIEGVEVIGKSKEAIIAIFGKPDVVYPTSIGYYGVETSIGFGFENNIVTICSLGLR